MNDLELLAPAKDFFTAKIALLYGADAVYIGGKKYSLRANSTNFSIEEIKELCIYAHSKNKRVYVTVNIILHNEDLDDLYNYLKDLEACQVDAIMVSDLSIIDLVKKNGINIDLYLSTQTSTYNYETANYWLKKGVKRIVLARECSKENIKRIKDVTNTNIECFIHGAMCISISGKCVMSNYCTLRDSNRGGCVQVCRWPFDCGLSNKLTISPKDLNMFSYLEEMANIGINSFKVEGRMRSIYYIATVIYVYRKLLDNLGNNNMSLAYINYYQNILNRCANRESVPQFFQKEISYEDQYYHDGIEVSNQDFLGIVKSYDKENKMMVIEERNYFKVGDRIELFGPTTGEIEFSIDTMYDENDNIIDVANHPQMIVKIPFDKVVCEHDMLRIKVIDKLDII